MDTLKNNWVAFCAIVIGSFALLTGPAHAVAQDYSSLTSGFASELAAALPVALAAVGLFIGVIMAYRVVRRVLSA